MSLNLYIVDHLKTLLPSPLCVGCYCPGTWMSTVSLNALSEEANFFLLIRGFA